MLNHCSELCWGFWIKHKLPSVNVKNKNLLAYNVKCFQGFFLEQTQQKFTIFTLSATDNLVQTTTISRPKDSDKLKVRVDVQKIGNMDLHISNLLRGRVIMGQFLFLVFEVDLFFMAYEQVVGQNIWKYHILISEF